MIAVAYLLKPLQTLLWSACVLALPVTAMAVRADVSWQSRVFFTPVNDAIESQRAYGLLHLRAGFEPQSRRWEVAVYVRNLGNQDYITGTASVPIPAITGRPGDPRQWGTQFTLRR